ncbi:MAG: S8 family peptidase [Xanthomonadaceae bacterium]|nr:S8 family peptidase [Xanthomonadaceae bacterium]
MTQQDDKKRKHFILSGTAEAEQFTSAGAGGGGSSTPVRNRGQHGAALLHQIQDLRPGTESARAAQEAAGVEAGFGLQVAFESFPDVELAFESLARERTGIELLNVRHEDERTLATVFVPDGKLGVFEGLIAAYLDESRDGKKGPRNSALLNTIAEIRAATLEELWTDDPSALPQSDDEAFWWEVWLPVRDDRTAVTSGFKRLARGLDFRVADGELQFPERTVLLVYGSAGQMKRSVLTLNSIAELRRAKDTAEFFDSLRPDEQPSWLDDLLGRMTIPVPGAAVPHVCLFDTGANHGHPLLRLALDDRDLHTVEPAWGVDDSDGHGTAMAGLALAGNLTEALASREPIQINHRLESVKLIPRDGANGGDAKHHGYLTIEAVARPEVTAPGRHRVFSMAVTARDNRDRGRPSSWSAAIDRLAADADGQGQTPRLFVISAGNVNDRVAWATYPNSNGTDGIHDPGQSWNALTVGATTALVQITEANTAGYQPIAPAGGLSPFSTTSFSWQPHWPLKPDVVFEGGNAATDPLGEVLTMTSLSLITANSAVQERLFTTATATSAASALAARMAAQLMAQYPELWPESIRALIVHSAEWTAAMRGAFLPSNRHPTKREIATLIRHCGFGTPELDRAMWSIENSLTMVCEEQLHPFKRDHRKEPSTRDMNLHRLPWPLEELEALGQTEVEMRVTLSYFIEPNPSARGIKSRYRYESHGLRFDVKRASESEADFRARINVAARDEEEQTRSGSADQSWVIGTQNRHKGSLHSDIWRGNAADLASRGVLAVYPALGWWKTRTRLERYDTAARYSLVVSIRAPEVDVDLYAAVANKVAAVVTVQT